MLSSGAGAAILAIALVLVLTGCGISDPYTTSRRILEHGGEQSESQRARRRRTVAAPHDRDAGCGCVQPADRAGPLRSAVRQLDAPPRYPPTSGGSRRSRAGQARAQALAEGNHPAPTVARYAVSNSGSVVAIAEGRGIERGRWAVVTVEQTNGYGPYQGLPATSHVTWATVARVAGGWVVSGWYPGS